jgi:glycosyltransferase involved in cell wall biosynthesis
MRQTPLVSVIVIFLNAERFIQEAIESVFTQTYGGWELLLVNDGSTDGSIEMAGRYARQHPQKVQLLAHEGGQNLGMSASRNLGIRHAAGQYIAFLDADDTWFPNTLGEQVAALEAQPEAAMVYGPLFWWYSWNGNHEGNRRDYIETLGVPANKLLKPPRLLPLFLLDKAAVPSGILVRREAIQRVGGFEDAFRGEYEDQVFCAKICLHEPVLASSRCWYRYRQHPGSAVAVGHQSGQTHRARMVFLSWLKGYLQEQGVRDTDVWRALRHELWRSRYPRLFHLTRRGSHVAGRMKEWLWAG